MALITILTACLLGTLAGLFQVAFLDASIWQGVFTYFAVSLALPTVVGLAALVRPATRRHRSSTFEDWHDWQMEEEMRGKRITEASVRSDRPARKSA